MKRLFALLLALAMLLSLAACGKDQEESVPEVSATSVQEAAKPENKLIYGSDSALTGAFLSGFGIGAGDMLVSDLVNDYYTLVPNQYGEYVENTTVLESFSRKENADGTATYTITIRDGLVYNNGDAITAKDFALRTMLGCSAAAADLGIWSSDYDRILGGREYKNKETDSISGIRILDEHTLTLTITEAYAQYYYGDTFAALLCWNPEFWLGEGWDITDTGEGAAFTFRGDVCQLDGSAVAEHFRSSQNGSRGEFVSAGPYSLDAFDPETGCATLTTNPLYQGNFEGQLPSIKTLVITRVAESTWPEDLRSGKLHVYEGISNGSDINTVLDMAAATEQVQYISYDRAGYGKLQFFCDVTPTQFVEVRQAIAMLLDRVAFADTYCQGWGTTVNGPYAPCLYQYQETKDRLENSLNPYTYDADGAIGRLISGGWVLDAKGNAYTSGLRYKEVTAEQAKCMEECITLEDGRILMPLIIKWCAAQDNPVTQLLQTMLVGAEQVSRAGMEIRMDAADWTAVISAAYRMDENGNPAEPYYSMVNEATTFDSAVYDHAYTWTDAPEFVEQGWNANYLFDMGEGGLHDLSMKMVYGEDVVGNEKAYLDLWAQYVERWNEMLPDLPLYSSLHVTAMPGWLVGYEQNALWGFADAVLYASIPSAK